MFRFSIPLLTSVRPLTPRRPLEAFWAGVVVLVATGLTTPVAAQVGGEDVRVALEDDLLDPLADAPGATLAVDSVGTIFTAVQSRDPAGPEIVVHRSADGGTTWDIWGTLGDAAAAETAGAPAIAVLPRPTGSGSATELLAVAHVHFDPTGGGTELRVSVAVPTEAVPTWTHYTAVPGVITRDPRVAVRRSASGERHLYVTYVDPSSNPAASEVRLVHKIGGGPFSAPVTVYAGGPSSILSHDVAAAAGDTVHVSCVEYDETIDTGWLYHTRSVDDGATWSIPLPLMTLSSPYAPLTSIAASPVSNEVAVVADITIGANPAIAIHYSADEGVTWLGRPNLSGRRSPDLAWSPSGCAMATVTQPAAESGSFLRADDGLNSWSADPMLRTGRVADLPAPVPSPLALASNPTQGDGFAMVGLMDDACDDSTSVELWFDAEWRTGAGYPTVEYQFGDINPGALSLTSPAVGDLNQNGVDDLVFIHGSSLFRFEDGRLDTLLSVASWTPGSPALGNIDGDGDLEIFFGDVVFDRVHGYDHLGGQLPGWPVALSSGSEVHVSLVEVDGVTTDIIAAVGNQVWAFAPDGTLRTGFPFTAPAAQGDVVGGVAIGDIDAAGGPELVAAFEFGVIALELDGNVQQVLHDAASGIVLASASLADLDGDLDLEIAFPVSNPGTIHLLHHDASPFGPGWPVDLATPYVSKILFADSDLDDVPSLHVFTRYDVKVVELDGTVALEWLDVLPNALLVQHVGQPGLQALALVFPGSVHALSGPNGESLPGYPYALCDEQSLAFATGNLDADPSVEIALLSLDGLFILDAGVPPGAQSQTWPMSGFNAARSSCAGCAAPPTVGVVDLPAAGVLTVLGAPRPNPAATGSTVRLRLDAADRTRVDIFDAAGRRVRTVRDGVMDAGIHEVRWDGADASGRAAAPGIYFMRVTMGEGPDARMASRKLTVIR